MRRRYVLDCPFIFPMLFHQMGSSMSGNVPSLALCYISLLFAPGGLFVVCFASQNMTRSRPLCPPCLFAFCALVVEDLMITSTDTHSCLFLLIFYGLLGCFCSVALSGVAATTLPSPLRLFVFLYWFSFCCSPFSSSVSSCLSTTENIKTNI